MFAPSFNPSFLGRGLFIVQPTNPITPSNTEVSVKLFNTYRNFALSIMPVGNPEVYYKVFNNADNKGVVGYGIHEKFIHYGQSMVDVSVGELDFPWTAADAFPSNEVSALSLVGFANTETDPVIAGRLRQIAQFVQGLPHYTKVYYYQGNNGVKSVTVLDKSNEVKMNLIVSWKL